MPALPDTSEVKVRCQFLNVPRFNRLATSVIKHYFSIREDGARFQLYVDSEHVDRRGDLLLSSPIFTSELETKSRQSSYDLLKVISVKGIDMISVWRKR